MFQVFAQENRRTNGAAFNLISLLRFYSIPQAKVIYAEGRSLNVEKGEKEC